VAKNIIRISTLQNTLIAEDRVLAHYLSKYADQIKFSVITATRM
jgi:hypothetical protein